MRIHQYLVEEKSSASVLMRDNRTHQKRKKGMGRICSDCAEVIVITIFCMDHLQPPNYNESHQNITK